MGRENNDIVFEGRPFLSNDILVWAFFPPLVGALRFFLPLLLVLTLHQQLRKLLAYFVVPFQCLQA